MNGIEKYSGLLRAFGAAVCFSLLFTAPAFADAPPIPVPEIDPGSAASTLTLLIGSGYLLKDRLRAWRTRS
jgi:hypothetical protein